ncbi:LysR family transcriptional regulator [Leptolyngbya sp. FACHB-261]|uniref:LysR family transcriptional regulator n=1 Tax=Leptolyngbya sp. FACHB-261 TaxID=2692806 RepID=UPI0016821A3E|nr:LysR family transcriptional regulator [Leptolyngbya sp. FACHB-261]MBD2102430.1 LysR family transcriptional regulator [Leptolyngbya sp. FACHB-261]
MKISQLQALVAVAEHGNFTEAAFSLDVSQSAISHAIAGLEEELGVSLLSRGRYGARLTSAGEHILPYARQMLDLQSKIIHQATLEKGLHGGRVRLTAFRSAAMHILPPAIAQFRSKFPNVAITVTEQDEPGIEQSLREGRADIGLTYRLSVGGFDACFDTWEITRDEHMMLIASSKAPKRKQLTWEDLATHSFIMTDCPEGPRILDHCAAAQVSLNVAYRVKEDSTVLAMVAQGLGATIMPSLAAAPLPKEIRAYRLPVPLPRVIKAVVLANALHSPAVFAFLDVLREASLLRSKQAN